MATVISRWSEESVLDVHCRLKTAGARGDALVHPLARGLRVHEDDGGVRHRGRVRLVAQAHRFRGLRRKLLRVCEVTP